MGSAKGSKKYLLREFPLSNQNDMMKNLLLILIFIIKTQISYSQLLKPKYDLNSAYGNTDMYINFKSLFENDPIAFFRLPMKDQSELKKSIYKKSDEYLKLQDSIKKIKDGRFKIGKRFYSSDAWWREPKYDIQKQGYNIFLNKNINNSSCPCPSKSYIPFGCEIIKFPQLDVITHNPDELLVKKNPKFKESKVEHFFLPVAEELALEMENNKDDIRIFFLFSIKEFKNETFRFAKFNLYSYDKGNFAFQTQTAKVLTTKELRIIILNRAKNEILVDQIY